MSNIYPSLNERFRGEGVCPICLMELAHSTRFTCENNHMICQRCRPYYYSCPRCFKPLTEITPEQQSFYEPPAPTHNMPHSPEYLSNPYPPSAPNLDDFHEHERHVNWNPPSPPSEQQELLNCPYEHFGCTAKFVPLLRDMHVSRCQYRLIGGEEELSQRTVCDDSERMPCKYQTVGCNVCAPIWRLNDHEQICIYKDRESGIHSETENDERIPCKYQSVGCNVRAPHWRLQSHENLCIYKDKINEISSSNEYEHSERIPCKYQNVGCNVRAPNWRLRDHELICIYKDKSSVNECDDSLVQHLEGSCRLNDDPNVMIECCYNDRGCRVKFPAWRKDMHESKCNYGSGMREPEIDPDMQVDCRWAEYGCRVKPKYERKTLHEEKCNYRMENCCFQHRGCQELLHPARKHLHEGSCSYAY